MFILPKTKSSLRKNFNSHPINIWDIYRVKFLMFNKKKCINYFSTVLCFYKAIKNRIGKLSFPAFVSTIFMLNVECNNRRQHIKIFDTCHRIKAENFNYLHTLQFLWTFLWEYFFSKFFNFIATDIQYKKK